MILTQSCASRFFIHVDAVALLQDRRAAGNDFLIAPLYHDDKGLPGDIEIPNSLVFPLVFGRDNHFLEFHVIRAGKRFRAENDYVACFEHQISVGYDGIFSPSDDRYEEACRELQFTDGFIGPGVPGSQLNADKSQSLVPSVVPQQRELGVLFYKSGADDTGRYRHHSYAEECDADAEEFAQRRDRIDVS